jgi:TPR repeat protein
MADDTGIEADVQAGIDAYDRGDLMAAISHYGKAAEAGSALAQARLAWIHDLSEDNAAAVEWYRASADQGHPDGQYGLGEMYAKGEGVEKDLDEAVLWFTRAAENGNLRAQRVLISAYENGVLGRTADPAKAATLQSKLDQQLAMAAEKQAPVQ